MAVVNITGQAHHIFTELYRRYCTMPACTAEDGKHCSNSCTSHCKAILQLHYKICFKSFKNTSISLIEIYLRWSAWNFLKICSLKLTITWRLFFGFFFHMQNKMSFFPARLTEEGMEAVSPQASPFIPSNPKAEQTIEEVSHIHLHVTTSQQEVNLYNHVHPILAI